MNEPDEPRPHGDVAPTSLVAAATVPHWPPLIPRAVDYPDCPVTAIPIGAARRYGDRTAFVDGDRRLTYAELLAHAERVAAALQSAGVGAGETVAVHLPNRLDYPVVYYGALLAGAVFSPANPMLPADQLAHQLDDCAAVVVIGDAAGRAARDAAVGSCPRLRLVIDLDGVVAPRSAGASAGTATPYPEWAASVPVARQPVPRAGGDLAHLAYTGGTTGRSKGVRLTQRNVVVNVVQTALWPSGALPELRGSGLELHQPPGAAELYPLTPGIGAVVNLAPWYHVMGNIGLLNAMVALGITVVIERRFEPRRYLEQCERWQVTMLAGAPPVFNSLLQVPDHRSFRLAQVRYVGSGAAPLPVTTIASLQEWLPAAVVAEGYGMTESTSGSVANPTARGALRKVGSVGVPHPDSAVLVAAPGGPPVPLARNAEGEVWLRGPQVMEGYHRQPGETAEVLVDGWLRTGDIGIVDDDGYLSIVDRAKDMLLYNGYNVYPRELEELLLTHPDVTAAAVVGEPHPIAGELPVAFVVARQGTAVDADAIVEFVAARVVPYKKLRRVEVVAELPVSAAGKVLRRELRQRLQRDE